MAFFIRKHFYWFCAVLIAMLNYSVYSKTAWRFLVQWSIGLTEPPDVTFRGFFSTKVFPRIPERRADFLCRKSKEKLDSVDSDMRVTDVILLFGPQDDTDVLDRPRLVMAAKGIKFDCCNVNLKDKPDWFFDLNPNGTVPVLEFNDGQVIYESVMSCEYLDEAYPQNPLFPKDLIEKHNQRVLIQRFDKKFSPAANRHRNDPSAKDDFIKELKFYEKELAARKSKYFGGTTPGMLDYIIWPWFERFDATENIKKSFDEADVPALKAWVKEMRTDPAVQACAMPTEWFIEFVKLYAKEGKAEAQLIGAK